MTTLTPEHARLLLEAAADDRLEALYVLALTTGMREGELLGLRWRDIATDFKSVEVRVSLLRAGAHGVLVILMRSGRKAVERYCERVNAVLGHLSNSPERS